MPTMPPAPSDYEVLKPGRLIVTYLGENDDKDDPRPVPLPDGLLSVVRWHTVALDSDEYQPVQALTKEMEVFFSHTEPGRTITIYKPVAHV